MVFLSVVLLVSTVRCAGPVWEDTENEKGELVWRQVPQEKLYMWLLLWVAFIGWWVRTPTEGESKRDRRLQAVGLSLVPLLLVFFNVIDPGRFVIHRQGVTEQDSLLNGRDTTTIAWQDVIKCHYYSSVDSTEYKRMRGGEVVGADRKFEVREGVRLIDKHRQEVDLEFLRGTTRSSDGSTPVACAVQYVFDLLLDSAPYGVSPHQRRRLTKRIFSHLPDTAELIIDEQLPEYRCGDEWPPGSRR